MRYLIIGGYGTLGFYLCKQLLAEGETVYVYDLQMDWSYCESPEGMPEPIQVDNLEQALSKKVDVIINLAEHTNPLTPAHMCINSHITLMQRLIEHLARTGDPIRMIVPIWDVRAFSKATPPEHSWWSISLETKTSIIQTFNIGNIVMSPYFTPRIVSGFSNDATFGNLVKRFYNCARHGRPMNVYPSEFGTTPVSWTSGHAAAKDIIELSRRVPRTRSITQPSYVIDSSPAHMINSVAHILNVDEMEIRGEYTTSRVEREQFYNSPHLEKIITEVLDECRRYDP